MAAPKKANILKKKGTAVPKNSRASKASGSRPSSAKTRKGSKPTDKKKVASKKTATKKPASGKKPATGTKTAARQPMMQKKFAAAKKTTAAKKTPQKAVSQKDRLLELRKHLLHKREAIVQEAKDEIAKYISGETRQLVDTALDDGDWATVDISEDINLNRLAAHRKTMLDIDESLRKIEEGTYGICEECGEEISEKRLNVLPSATLCIICQERKELLEAVMKEEVE